MFSLIDCRFLLYFGFVRKKRPSHTKTPALRTYKKHEVQAPMHIRSTLPLHWVNSDIYIARGKNVLFRLNSDLTWRKKLSDETGLCSQKALGTSGQVLVL